MNNKNDNTSILTVVPEQKFKIVIVGEQGVGKTTLFKNFIDELGESTSIQQTQSEVVTTIDFRIKSQMVDNTLVKYYLWDTAGQEKYRSMVSAYFKGCQAVLILFDLTNQYSRDQAISVWVKLSQEKTSNALIYLIGNKSDLDGLVCDRKQNLQLAQQNKCKYYETSALYGIGVIELFLQAGREIQSIIKIGMQQIKKQNEIIASIDKTDTDKSEVDYTSQAEQIINKKNSFQLESNKLMDFNKEKQQKTPNCNKCSC